MNNSTDNDNLRSPKVRKMLGEIPIALIIAGYGVIILIIIILAAFCYLFPTVRDALF